MGDLIKLGSTYGLDVQATLAVIDAGFSGDWSRIGVLTTGAYMRGQQLCMNDTARPCMPSCLHAGTAFLCSI